MTYYQMSSGSGDTLLVVIDRATGYVWQTVATSGTIYTGYPGNEINGQLEFSYPTADCSGSAVYFDALPMPRYTFFGTDGNVYARGDSEQGQTVTVLGQRSVQSAASPCQSQSLSNQPVIAVSGSVNLGPNVPTSLFAAPAHPEIAP